MRNDYQLAISALKQRITSLGQFNSTSDFAARLLDVTELLFEHPMLSAAIDAECDGRGAIVLQHYEELLAHRFLEDVPQLAADVLASKRPDVPRADEILKACVHGQEPLEEQILKISQTTAVDLITHWDLPTVRDRLTQAVFAAKLFDPSDAWEKRSSGIVLKINDAHRAITFVRKFGDRSTLTPRIAALRNTYTALAGLRAGLNKEPLALLYQLEEKGRQAELVSLVERLASLIEQRVGQDVLETHAVRRLMNWLSWFGKSEIVADITLESERVTSASERGQKAKHQYEKIVQRHTDRFLFHEGLVPITHAEFAGGEIDTFIDRHDQLFVNVALAHQRPTLIELKVCLGTTVSELRRTIDLACSQARTYAAAVRARYTWRDVHARALVVYDGATRYEDPETDVLLVLIGEARPHEGAKSVRDSRGSD
jgi:hypothetical protein